MTVSQDAVVARVQAALGPGYQVEHSIGQGGFAAVYLVRDLTLKRPLAVKVLSPDLLASATARERFRREAETVAQLSHPHIVPLHFIGDAQDVVYLVMAFVDGESLADRIQREGRLDPEEAARIMREVASALDLAHRRGVIHRDIKPQNVLLERETGRSLVTDFGIARTAENASITATGMVVGTPTYMSPEQVTGGAVDHRADLYALGCVGYEMLVGRPPFSGTTPTEILMKRVAQPAEPVERARPDTPPALSAVINRCLEQDPEKRYASGADIVRALGGVTTPSGGQPTAEGPRARGRRHRLPLALALGAVVVLIGAVVALLLRQGAARRPTAPATPEGMVLVPAGTYTIGRNDGPQLSRPAHPAAVGAFYMDRTEVTIAQFRRIASATSLGAAWSAPAATVDSLLPVTGVTWPIAMAYCGIARPPRGRLPTEEEWEAAARGPNGFRYPWGETWQGGLANTYGARRKGPLPVGSLRGGNTALGISDLIGNVWEWTASPAVTYPGGASPVRSKEAYVIRGGAFNTPDSIADATYRGYLPAMSAELAFTGFRCALPVK
ncbi:MAG: bifunctional serine/threonine-protein kinase/formylglycine-generating enzyme family protein [Gemmatimonadales bacterium]